MHCGQFVDLAVSSIQPFSLPRQVLCATDAELLYVGIIRQDNTCCIASPKSSFQPFGMQHPLRRNG
jgi:hypothetical protein